MIWVRGQSPGLVQQLFLATLCYIVTMSTDRIRKLARAFRIKRGFSQASQEDLDYLHQKTGLQHDGLGALLSELNGSNYEAVLPEFDFLLDARNIADQYLMYLEIYSENSDWTDIDQADLNLAGTESMAWSRSFLPITNNGSGDGWVLDLRRGVAAVQ
jgi:hypothetical protein